MDLLARIELPQAPGHRLHALGVVAPVQDQVRGAAGQLHPPGPYRPGQALVKGLPGDVPAPPPQGLHHLDGGGGVAHLIVPHHGDAVFLSLVAEHLPLPGQGLHLEGLRPGEGQLHPPLPAHRLHHLLGLPALAVEDGPAARLDDAGLLPGDKGDGVPQLLRVLQAQIGDDRHLGGGDHVGGVQTPPQAHLQYHDVTGPLLEPHHGHGGHQLELGGRVGHVPGGLQHPLGDPPQVLVGDGDPVDLEPLAELPQVGGGVQAGAVSRPAQHAGHHGGGGALAVGAGDVDEFQPQMGVAQPAQQLPGALQPRGPADPGLLVDSLFRLPRCHHAARLLSRVFCHLW